MSLINEINIKRESINDKSSLIEKLFYSLLSEKGMGNSVLTSKLSNFEKIAYSSFCDNSFDISAILKKEQKVDSNFDYHYSNNLIELSAMSLADFDFEKSNINTFLKTASLKEAFIISKVFPDFAYSTNKNIETIIDGLVSLSFVKKDVSSFPNSIIETIQSADDLIDIFIIEKCYENYVDIHPVTNSTGKLSLLLSSIDKYNTQNEARIKTNLFIKIVFSLTIFSIVIAYIIPQYWNKYTLEPLVTSTLIIAPIITMIVMLYFFLFHKLDNKKSILTKYIDNKIKKLNSKLKIESVKIEEIRKDLTNE